MKAEDAVHRDVCIFRGKALGGSTSAMDILSLYSVPIDIAKKIAEGNYEYEDENISITSEKGDESTEIKIKFKVTLI